MKDIIAKVRMKLALNKAQQNIVNLLLSERSRGASYFFKMLRTRFEEERVSYEDQAKILESLIKHYKVHLDKGFKEGFKELVNTPQIKTYLSGLIF